MARAPKPLFLARSSYRQRRLADAARAMPVFSALLLVLPLLWPAAGDGSGAMAFDLGYLLVLWLVMIMVSALLAKGLMQGESGGAPRPPPKAPPADAAPEAEAPLGQGQG